MFLWLIAQAKQVNEPQLPIFLLCSAQAHLILFLIFFILLLWVAVVCYVRVILTYLLLALPMINIQNVSVSSFISPARLRSLKTELLLICEVQKDWSKIWERMGSFMHINGLLRGCEWGEWVTVRHTHLFSSYCVLMSTASAFWINLLID